MERVPLVLFIALRHEMLSLFRLPSLHLFGLRHETHSAVAVSASCVHKNEGREEENTSLGRKKT